MSRTNTLYIVIAVLVVIVAVVSWQLYQERQAGVQINVGPNGLSVQSK
jgi:hypothetical protein